MKKLYSIFLIMIISLGLLPINVNADKDNWTLKDHKDELKKFQAEAAATQSSINKTESEIAKSNAEISSIKAEMIRMASEINQLQQDIIDYNEKINKKDFETKKLIEYLQISQGQNVYLEYAFGADSITDLIYRMAVVEQMTEYNDKVIDELNTMIKANHEREKEINEKEKQLTNKQEQLKNKVVELGDDKEALEENGVKVSEQIKIKKKLIETYEKNGCKDNDVIGVDCMKTVSAGAWRRPTTIGYVTSEVGPRWGRLHRGLDIGNSMNGQNPYSTKIYAVASGTITSIHKDSYGALLVLVEHYDANKKTYYTSQYAHLSKYNPAIYVGMKVTSDTWLGYMGMSGYATGPHLDLELYPCRLYNSSDKNCSTWSKYTAYVQKLYNSGYKGARSVIDFPKGTYNRWTTR